MEYGPSDSDIADALSDTGIGKPIIKYDHPATHRHYNMHLRPDLTVSIY